MKILVINGPNLNMLGIREKNLYGENSYKFLIMKIKDHVKLINKENKNKKLKVKIVQSNYEGKIVTIIQKAYQKYDGIVINAGAYTHTSVAILDALKSVNIDTVEVHITDINNRDDFRKFSYISLFAKKVIVGKGLEGYVEGINYLYNNNPF